MHNSRRMCSGAMHLDTVTAEVAEEYAREKPMRIRIPVAYDGEPPRSLG